MITDHKGLLDSASHLHVDAKLSAQRKALTLIGWPSFISRAVDQHNGAHNHRAARE
jgi:hypothetical protein